MLKNTFAIAILALLTFSACKKKADTNTPEMKELSPEFRTFYENFHSDSLYQFKHVAFPLKGLPSDADSSLIAADTFFYREKDWRMHRPVDFSKGEFVQSIVPVTEGIIVEHIFKSDNSFGIERRFAKLSDGQWNLIYYVAPNRFSIHRK